MRVLIMVLSSLKQPYDKLMAAQKQTWDSPYVANVSTAFYYGTDITKRYWNQLPVKCSDEYEMMHWKFKLALDEVINDDWDYIFRTNSSTYVRKDKIYDFLKDKPREKYYAGEDGGGFVSGAGMCLSRDCAEILRKEITSDPSPAEDCMIGSLLLKHGIAISPGPLRLNFNFAENKILEAAYYRCKSEKEVNGQLDRSEDVRAFNELYFHFDLEKDLLRAIEP